MGVRERHANMLINAANSIAVVNRLSPMPEKCLAPALANIETVWNESASYIDPNIKRPIRIAIVTLRGLLKVTANDENLVKEDVIALRRSEKAIREVSTRILKDRRSKRVSSDTPNYSATGSRYTDPKELAGEVSFTVVPSDFHAQNLNTSSKSFRYATGFERAV